MNWYQNRKLADQALPEAELMPMEKEIDKSRQTGLETIDKRLKPDKAKKEKIKHPNLQYLGAGNYGIAYLPAKESYVVLKYTSDRHEYLNAKKVLELQKEYGGPLPGVVTVYYMEAISVEQDIYKIWLERAKPLSTNEKEVINKLLYVANFSSEPQTISNELLLAYNDVEITDENILILNKLKELYNNIFMNSMYGDIHIENIGKNSNGDYVILDLGGIF